MDGTNPQPARADVCTIRRRRRLINKLIHTLWILVDRDAAVRRRVMKLQRDGLPLEAASGMLQVMDESSAKLNAWAQQVISSNRVANARDRKGGQ